MNDDDKDKKVIDALRKLGKIPVEYPKPLEDKTRKKFVGQIRLGFWFWFIVFVLLVVICLLLPYIKF